MITINTEIEKQIKKEHSFLIFKHCGFVCCVARMPFNGNLNGYVGINKKHPLFGKHYSDKIKVEETPEFNGNYIGLLCSSLGADFKDNIYSIDMIFNVHCGITYSKDDLYGIDSDILGKLWWFGFDTSHAGDAKVYQNDTDREYPTEGDVYRNFEFVKSQTESLAEQLRKFDPVMEKRKSTKNC